jgi:hypothetical protein
LQLCDAGREADAGRGRGAGRKDAGRKICKAILPVVEAAEIELASRSLRSQRKQGLTKTIRGAEEPNVPPLVQTLAAIEIQIADGLLGDALDILTP